MASVFWHAKGILLILLHQDNMPVHEGGIVETKLAELKFKTLEHRPYSPNLAIFPKLKKYLGAMRFASDEELSWTTTFEELEEDE
ncbi:hypothetical protein Trydic_g2310 [Trypoxylus dichotomus]